MHVPAVSVIIPVYNRRELLKDAVNSVLSQTYKDYELIIVDDASTDKTPDFIRSFAADHKNVKPLFCSRHSGMPGAVRNRGAEKAAGRYLAFLDSDDLWVPEKLEKQMAFFSFTDYRIVHTREKWVRNEIEVSQASQIHKREGDIFSDALRKCIIGPSTVIMEKKLYRQVHGFDEYMEIAEDYEIWLRITSTEKVGYLDEPLTVKQAGHWEQLSEKYGQIEIFRIKALKKLLDQKFFDPAKYMEAAGVFSEKCKIYAAGCKKRGRAEEAEEYERLSCKYLR